MQSLNSRAASVSLESYGRDRLAESDFFSSLSAGDVAPGHVRDVFGQYYLWRNRFHRWLGVCVAKSAALGDALNVPRVLGELNARLAREAGQDDQGPALSLLSALGLDNPARIAALPVTEAYADSFPRCYFPAERSGDEALAALAGRELVVPGRNGIIVGALRERYGITSGLEFFRPHADSELASFAALWESLSAGSSADHEKLLESARMEIWEHVAFWDDVYSAVVTDGRPSAAVRVMTGK
jgi:hypothetical protein